MNRNGAVYILKMGKTSLYKIGHVKCLKEKSKYSSSRSRVSKRISQYQSGNPIKLDLIHLFETSNPWMIENQFHGFFSPDYLVDREWFYLNSDQLDDAIESIIVNGEFYHGEAALGPFKTLKYPMRLNIEITPEWRKYGRVYDD